VAGREDLPFALLHGVPLYLHALRSLVAASPEGVSVVVTADHEDRVRGEVLDAGLSVPVLGGDTWWSDAGPRLRGSLLVHDPLCPLTSREFLAEVRRTGHENPGVSLAAFRPVTDTVKTVVDERIHGTIDREGLAALIAPVLIAAQVLRDAVAAADEPPLENFGELLGWLRSRGPVELVKGPSLARRVDDASAVNLLECVDEVGRSVHTGPGGGRPAG
jgi:2-C-methyl-D-erythritol 4-phosphate cytidylyltransferase